LDTPSEGESCIPARFYPLIPGWDHSRMPARKEAIRKLIETILDPDVPLWMKGLAAAALAYFLLVPDLIPDFFGIPGYLDDAAVVCAAVANLGAALRRHNSAKHPKERRKP